MTKRKWHDVTCAVWWNKTLGILWGGLMIIEMGQWVKVHSFEEPYYSNKTEIDRTLQNKSYSYSDIEGYGAPLMTCASFIFPLWDLHLLFSPEYMCTFYFSYLWPTLNYLGPALICLWPTLASWRRHGGMGGSGSPLLFRPLLRFAQIRWEVFYIYIYGGGPMHVYCNFSLLTSK